MIDYIEAKNKLYRNIEYVYDNYDEKPYIMHFTHNDSDALGCAIVLYYTVVSSGVKVVNKFLPAGGDTRDTTIKEFLKELIDAESPGCCVGICISDISISEETATLIDEYVENIKLQGHDDFVVMGFDHHLSNTLKRDWFNIKGIEGDRKISACELMYTCLIGDLVLNVDVDYSVNSSNSDILRTLAADFESLILSISLYDTWEWKTHPLREKYRKMCTFKCCDNSIDLDIIPTFVSSFGIEDAVEYFYDIIDQYEAAEQNEYDMINDFAFPELLMTIHTITRTKIDEIYKRTYRKVTFCTNNQFIVGMFVGEDYSSLVCDKLYSEYPFVDYFIILYPSSHTVGFRSNKKDVNVSLIASRLFDGGGHPGASGAVIKPIYFLRLMYLYYNSLNYEELCNKHDVWTSDDPNTVFFSIKKYSKNLIIADILAKPKEEDI